jgi:hypothetical protein
MPDLVQLHKRYESKGLYVIATESQNSEDADIAKIINKARGKFAVMKKGSYPKPIRGIPHAFLFDREGKLITEGHPQDKEFEKAVKTAVTAAP